MREITAARCHWCEPRRRPQDWLAVCCAALLCLAMPGCALFEQQAKSAGRQTALSWLTQWVSQPIEMTAGFDPESIRPPPREAPVPRGALLEITVWDLEEPGRPDTFPVRVSEELTIDIPLAGAVSVAGRTIAEVEALLIDAYRKGEFLLEPRVLVRSLDPSVLRVEVKGAVQHPGFVELPRVDSSVYAALVSAGGLKKSAGTQVAVVRRRQPKPQPAASLPDSGTPPLVRELAPETEPRAPQSIANSGDVLSVAASAENRTDAKPGAAANESAVDSAPLTSIEDSHPARPEAQISWYDLTRDADLEQVRAICLAEGDAILVKSATPPVRIGGVVERPGAYALPPTRAINVWQALELAGGVAVKDVPLNITLIHPAGEGRAARRWDLKIDSYANHPSESPDVGPGDVIHVEPTAGGRIRRAVGDLWSRP